MTTLLVRRLLLLVISLAWKPYISSSFPLFLSARGDGCCSPPSSRKDNTGMARLRVLLADEQKRVSKSKYYRTVLHSEQCHQSEDLREISIPFLIVGGGIHGVHIAARLIGSERIKANDLRIIDPNDTLLHSWKRRTASTGMEYLRSSGGYHLDLEENSLRQSRSKSDGANSTKRKRSKRKRENRRDFMNQNPEFSNDYQRPRLDVFNDHCDSVIARYCLEELHTKGIVTAIEPCDDTVRVRVQMRSSSTMEGVQSLVYSADRIVLALGNDDPSYAEWVEQQDIEAGRVRHLFDDEQKYALTKDFSDTSSSTGYGDIVIVGGGISAAHKALELVAQKRKEANGDSPEGKIHVISRHPLKEQQFDTHQDWMMDGAAIKRSKDGGGYGMPRRQRLFSELTSWTQRRQVIARERLPGTVTPAVSRGKNGLRYAIQNGDIQWHQADIQAKREIRVKRNADEETKLELSLSTGVKIETDHVILATGFGKKPPGGKVVQRDLIQKAGLRVSGFCGFPIVDQNLLWHPRIHVTGALAELELGPSARNIAGARLAAERISEAVGGKRWNVG